MGGVPGPPSSWSCAFSAEPTSVSSVREFVRRVLLPVGSGVDLEAVVLMSSELASNAIMHAQDSDLEVRVELSPASVRVGVRDANPDLPVLQEPSLDTDSGWGMGLVDRLSEAWGVDGNPEGKWVWFRSNLA